MVFVVIGLRKTSNLFVNFNSQNASNGLENNCKILRSPIII